VLEKTEMLMLILEINRVWCTFRRKAKLKFNGLTENQLYRYVKEARRRRGVTGLILLQLLEMRLDTFSHWVLQNYCSSQTTSKSWSYYYQ
jgi:ribosomal protein S4